VLLSSHLLHEVQIIADELIVIGNGTIVAQGTKDELLQASGTFVRAGDNDALARALEGAGIVATTSGSGLTTEATPEQVGKAAAAEGVALVELRQADGAGLEEMFLQLTASTQRDGVVTEGAQS
jgi:ABC-2 type transport system ATP-binding protein